MNLRHAAALALVGWYLMMPPFVPSPPQGQGRMLDLKAPLGQWYITGSYDGAAECAAALSVQHKKTDKAFKEAEDTLARNAPKDREFREFVISTAQAQDRASACIATDDPRLKEN